MAMGSFAQGFRFAITLILNMTLQKLGGKRVFRNTVDGTLLDDTEETRLLCLSCRVDPRKRLDKWQKEAETKAGRCH